MKTKTFSLSLSLLVAALLSLVTIKACNPVVNAGEEAELSEAADLDIAQELHILVNYSNEITSRFTALSPEEQRGWVERAQTLLNNPAINRHQIRGDYREGHGIDYDLLDADELLSLQTAFEDLFDPIIPTELIEEMTSVANAIMQKRPDMMTMDEGEVLDVLSTEMKRIMFEHKSEGKGSSGLEQIVSSQCVNNCGGQLGTKMAIATAAKTVGIGICVAATTVASPGCIAGVMVGYHATVASLMADHYWCVQGCAVTEIQDV